MNRTQAWFPTFKNYQTIAKIGSGGFGDTYLAKDKLGRQCVIKQVKLKANGQDSIKSHEQFRREVCIQACLDHPNIARLIDYNDQEGYIVMDYANGGTLRKLLDGKFPNGMDPHTALTILKPICRALIYSHEKNFSEDGQRRGIVHLDIKPENILIQNEASDEGGTRPRYLLADFGLARWISQTGRAYGGNSLVAGTFGYMAPEQLVPGGRFGGPGPRSDIYALGVMLREMLSGQRPRQLFQPLPKLGNAISLEVEAVVQKATAQNSQDRYSSVEGFLMALTQAVEKTGRISGGMNTTPQRSGLLPDNFYAFPPSYARNRRAWWRSSWVVLMAGITLLTLVGGSVIWRISTLSSSPHYTLCIGTDFPVSGSDTSQGIPARNGADLAIAQHQDLGNGSTLAACDKDDVSRITGIHDAGQGAQNVRDFVGNKNIVGIVGPLNSNVARAEIPIAASAGVVLISPQTTDPCLTLAQYCANPDQVHHPGVPNTFFRIPGNDLRQGEADAELLIRFLGRSKVCVVDDQDVYGKGLADAFSAGFQHNGGRILGARMHTSADDTSIQIATLAAQIIALQPNAVFYGGVTANGAGLLQEQLFQAGFTGLFVGGDGIGLDQQFLQSANSGGTYATVSGPDSSAFPKSFRDAYQLRYGTLPTQLSANGYDAAMILIIAIQSALETDPQNLRSAVLQKVQYPNQPYHGITGTITFDSNGDNAGTSVFSVYAVENKSWIYKPKDTILVSG
jgi:branched-chain amino acid transport system substrate-binding protein